MMFTKGYLCVIFLKSYGDIVIFSGVISGILRNNKSYQRSNS